MSLSRRRRRKKHEQRYYFLPLAHQMQTRDTLLMPDKAQMSILLPEIECHLKLESICFLLIGIADIMSDSLSKPKKK
jgi:hypothetical protein